MLLKNDVLKIGFITICSLNLPKYQKYLKVNHK